MVQLRTWGTKWKYVQSDRVFTNEDQQMWVFYQHSLFLATDFRLVILKSPMF